MTDYRVNVKVRNARLLRAIEKAGHQSGLIFATKAGISYAGHLLPYINLKRSPYDEEDGSLRECAEKICVFLNLMPCELWSDEQHCALKVNTAEVEMTADSVYELLSRQPDVSDPIEFLEKQQATQALDGLLEKALSPREKRFIELRYGVDGEGLTYDALAKKEGLTKERVRKIEQKALRKIRLRAANIERL